MSDHPVEYRLWASLKSKCSNHLHPEYKNYGKRGTTVCERWQSFSNFFEDLGPRPSPRHTLRRVDPTRGFEPGNVFWGLRKKPAVIHVVPACLTYRGETKTLQDWSLQVGLPLACLRARLRRGLSVEEALFRSLWERSP